MKLQLEHVSKAYRKGRYALDDLSVEFTAGVYGILGANGAGKSTMLNIITDNLCPTQGQVTYDGEEIHHMGERYREILGYMPQQQSLYDHFTGEEFLWYMAALKGLSKKTARDKLESLLELVNLTEQKDKKIGSYSGGMKQRILIAQALLNDPKLLVLDEPTAGLDPSERIRIRNLLSEISSQKIILLATHLVSDIEFIAKSVVLIREGKLIANDSPMELLRTMEDKVYEVEVGMEEDYRNNSAKIANIRLGMQGKIYRVISDERITGENVQRVKPNLEDLYLYHMS